jgi:hypothetical protein
MHNMTDQEIVPLISSLIVFLGRDRVNKSIKSWRKSIETSKGLVLEYYKYQTFRWWPAFVEFEKIVANGNGNYSVNVMALARDAKRIFELLSTMPNSIQKKFASTLVSREGTAASLFEIHMAWHYMKSGYRVSWCEDNGIPMPEFIVYADNFEFEVECKELSVDKCQRISREDFARFGDILEAQIRPYNVMGEICVTLKLSLPHDRPSQGRIASAIASLVKRGEWQREASFPWGDVKLLLKRNDNVAIDFPQEKARQQSFQNQNAFTAILARNSNGVAVDPLYINVSSSQKDQLLIGLSSLMKDAVKRQLSGPRPGLLCVYLPEIDVQSLKGDSGLTMMTSMLFDSSKRSHVLAAIFSSDDNVSYVANGVEFKTPALICRNPKCHFPQAQSFHFIDIDQQ